MASRYWVGGTADWDGTAGTKWAATSGGAGGEAVPTSSDDVFFDANSGSGTVTIAAGETGCANLNCTGFTGTLAGSEAQTISGSLTLASGMTLSYTGIWTFNGTGVHTITSAGKTFGGSIRINDSTGVGSFTLQDAFSSTSSLNVWGGTFDANDFNITATLFNSATFTNTRTINMGSGTWTLTGTNVNAWNISVTNLTLNEETSTIKLTGGSTTPIGFVGAGETYYNLWIATTTTGENQISGNNTFTQLRIDAGRDVEFANGSTTTIASAAGVVWNGTSGNNISLHSATGGTAWTISVASGTVTGDYLTLQDSTATGGATFNATNSTDVSGNTGWNFLVSFIGKMMLI